MLKTAVQVKSKIIHVQCQWRHLTPALLDRASDNDLLFKHLCITCHKVNQAHPGNCAATGRVGVGYARAAQAFITGIKCRHSIILCP